MKKDKTIKYVTEEQKEVRKFVFILVGLVVVLIGIYFFTRAFIVKDLFNNNKETTYTDGEINYDVAIVGNMLNRPYTEYYVIAFNSESTKANYYNTLSSKYMTSDGSLKLYYIDLNNSLNSKYVASEDDKYSTEFKSLDDLKLGEITLIKVKNKKVVKFITDIEMIKEELTK